MEDLIARDADLEEIWKQLDGYFGNPHNRIDSTIKEFFEVPKPSKDIVDF